MDTGTQLSSTVLKIMKSKFWWQLMSLQEGLTLMTLLTSLTLTYQGRLKIIFIELGVQAGRREKGRLLAWSSIKKNLCFRRLKSTQTSKSRSLNPPIAPLMFPWFTRKKRAALKRNEDLRLVEKRTINLLPQVNEKNQDLRLTQKQNQNQNQNQNQEEGQLKKILGPKLQPLNFLFTLFKINFCKKLSF
jgi:hypothetical protein